MIFVAKLLQEVETTEKNMITEKVDAVRDRVRRARDNLRLKVSTIQPESMKAQSYTVEMLTGKFTPAYDG